EGGKTGGGVIFEVTSAGKYSVLHNFCVEDGCTDGAGPSTYTAAAALTYPGAGSGEPYDEKHPLTGFADTGPNLGGLIYTLTPPVGQSQGHWTYQMIYGFCAEQGCYDGQVPAGLDYVEQGAPFGTTVAGGLPSNAGTVFLVDNTGKVG